MVLRTAPAPRGRWWFADPSAPVAADREYVLEVNPHTMTSPVPARSVRTTADASGRSRTKVAVSPAQTTWTVTGYASTRAQHDALVDWATRPRHFRVHDHLGRAFDVKVVRYALRERHPTRARPDRWEWTFDMLVLKALPRVPVRLR